MQHAQRIAAQDGGLGCARLVQRLVAPQDGERVQRRLRRLGLIKRPSDDLDRRQLFPADEPRGLARA
jgi:hypothetical protein